LREAAQNKLRSGDAQGAVGLLLRALEERPSSVLYPEIVAELGHAEAQLGAPAASERLEEAIKLTEDPTRRAELALARGRLLDSQEQHHEAAAVFDSGSRELAGNEGHLAAELDAAYVAAASQVPELEADALSRRTKMLDSLNGPPTAQQRSALARALVLDGLRGGSRPKVRRLADLAWSDGALLHENPAPDVSVASLSWALLFVDELERDIEICEQICAGPHAESMAIQQSTINALRAWPRYQRGEIDGAAADAEAALGVPDHCQRASRAAYAALTCCRLLRGQLEHAERALAIVWDGHDRTTTSHPFLLEARAQLCLAQRRPADALNDALRAGDILESEHGVTNPGVIAWRSTAALAEIALGRCDRAEALAAQELERAKHRGVTRVVIRDLRILGLAAGGKTGIELLEQAVHTAEHYPARLEGMLALVDLGAALRRAKRRTAAREPLRRGLELSYRGGATFVAERARMELTATGARPRRVMLSGLESLTPGERRVADLAAQEMTTREIAEALFITPKTVEYHLRHIYQKLSVSSRSELATMLATEQSVGA
jgi:DNA-binding CsgD family transcriptional regulator